MVHIFHFLQTGMVFEIVNPFSLILNVISTEKSWLISKPFLTCLLDVMTLDFYQTLFGGQTFYRLKTFLLFPCLMSDVLFVWTATYQTCLMRACVPWLLSGLNQLFDLCLIKHVLTVWPLTSTSACLVTKQCLMVFGRQTFPVCLGLYSSARYDFLQDVRNKACLSPGQMGNVLQPNTTKPCLVTKTC